MNRYLESSLKIDLATVITRITDHLIDISDFMNVLINPPADQEDLMDFVDRDDIGLLLFAIEVVKDLTSHLSADHMHALRRQLISLQDDRECTDCGGTLLISCTCEG